VLVANHVSDLDPLLLSAVLGYRRLRHLFYWGGEVTRLFARRWQRPLMQALHVFPLDERAPARGLALAGAVLRRGDSVVWFPESWRSPDGGLQRFLPGVVWTKSAVHQKRLKPCFAV
jgi:long-chain acyl-CoA synthetase